MHFKEMNDDFERGERERGKKWSLYRVKKPRRRHSGVSVAFVPRAAFDFIQTNAFINFFPLFAIFYPGYPKCFPKAFKKTTSKIAREKVIQHLQKNIDK